MKDLHVKNGHLTTCESTDAHVEDTLLASVGHFKCAPVFGVAVRRMVHGTYRNTQLSQRMDTQLRAQKIRIKNVCFNNGKININYL